LFVGLDSAEAHHDVCLMNEEGRVLARKRVVDVDLNLATKTEYVRKERHRTASPAGFSHPMATPALTAHFETR
jgi:hypothetical protein